MRFVAAPGTSGAATTPPAATYGLKIRASPVQLHLVVACLFLFVLDPLLLLRKRLASQIFGLGRFRGGQRPRRRSAPTS
jgi:hypothetical protein